MRIATQVEEIAQVKGDCELLMAPRTEEHDSLGTRALSVALIGPNVTRRSAVAGALRGSQATVTRELISYPSLDEVPMLLEADYDVVIIELDTDPEHALDLVEATSSDSSVTVMVYSAVADSAMLVRCMRAGAREFLSLPLAPGTMEEAMVRAMVRRPSALSTRKTVGKVMVFIGAKGGSGVTTIATNFAVVLAQESQRNVVLIDLGLPIGDAALGLGIRSEFSIVDALENYNRLDSNFFLKLLSKHSSGLSILAAPDGYAPIQATVEAVERLLIVAQQTFDYVIVDAGSNLGPVSKVLFNDASKVYLVTQVSIPEIRNSHRLIGEFFGNSRLKPEIVLNRFTPRSLGIDEGEIARALTLEPKWKVPSDYQSAMRAQNAASALVMEDSVISRVIRQMGRTACDLPKQTKKKGVFSLFG